MSPAFRLAGLLRLRNIEEDRAAARLAEARARAAANDDTRLRMRAELGGMTVDDLDENTLRVSAAARSSSASMLAELAGVQRRLSDETEQAASAHAAAKQRAAVLENLADAHRDAAIEAELRAEQTVLDELASSGHSRNGAGRAREGGRHAGS